MKTPPPSPPPIYEIETVADFLTVPNDRIAICLDEFSAWIESAKALGELIESLSEMADIAPDGVVEFKKIVWIDDGMKNVTIELVEKAGE